MRLSISLTLVLAVATVLATGCTSTAAPSPTPTSLPTPTLTPTPTAVPTATPLPPISAEPTDDGESSGPSVAEQSHPSFLPDVASVVEKALPAVVQVLATVGQTNIFGQYAEGRSQGSGVFFDEHGYLLTNNHVVEDAIEVEVVLSNRQRLPAVLVGSDPQTDLAVLKINPRDVDDLVVAPLGDTDAMRIGDWVIAIGSPLGFTGSVTVGVVSAKGRSLDVGTGIPLWGLLQTDAVINPGNSGGPLLNLKGEVIGINTAIIRGLLSSGQEADGIGFSISMNTAIPVSSQIIENGRVIRPRMGVSIEDVTPLIAAERGLATDDGALVVALTPGGPAERAGIELNDVITGIDGTPIASTTDLVNLFLVEYGVGDDVIVNVIRSALHLSFELILEDIS